jgi:hypothetical protein
MTNLAENNARIDRIYTALQTVMEQFKLELLTTKLYDENLERMTDQDAIKIYTRYFNKAYSIGWP